MREYTYRFEAGLAVGLRNGLGTKRDTQALFTSDGLYPLDGTLNSLEVLNVISVDPLSPVPYFPFPQIFETKLGMILVCTQTVIYTYEGAGVFTPQLIDLVPGHCWTIADFQDFIFMTNGKQTCYLNAISKTFSKENSFGMKNCNGVCNFNGQVIVAAPETTL